MENKVMYIHSQGEFEKEIKDADFVLVDFFADRCGPCQMVSPILEELAKKKNNWKILKVNIDENEDLARQYEVMSIPAMFYFYKGEKREEEI